MKVKPVMFVFGAVLLLTAVVTALVVALLLNIQQRKQEARVQYVKLTELTEDTIDPAEWGKNFPRQYDGYKRTVDTARTKFGGSEAFQKLDEDPMLRTIFAGYAFGVDYREERGHAYSLVDQDSTARTRQFKQPGACLQCHAGGMRRLYEKAGDGDMWAGFAKVCAMPLSEARKQVQHPVACIDCHDPENMQLRVTRPGFIEGIKQYKKSQGIDNYDPNTMATRQEMRGFVCGQCHVEYYFKGDGKLLTYPWHDGLKVEEIEKYYDKVGHTDWVHAISKAPMLKAQHPEFEMWNQGVHSKSGVACADCHMPYMRQGAAKISDHHIRSPLLNVSRACLPCHRFSEKEMFDRAITIQERNQKLLHRAEEAVVALIGDIDKARKAGATEAQLDGAKDMHRKAQWRLDFVAAENSMGFHAPQEAARILAEAIDYARQGQLLLKR